MVPRKKIFFLNRDFAIPSDFGAYTVLISETKLRYFTSRAVLVCIIEMIPAILEITVITSNANAT